MTQSRSFGFCSIDNLFLYKHVVLNLTVSEALCTQHFYEHCQSCGLQPWVNAHVFFNFKGQESLCIFVKGDVLVFSIKFVENRLMQDLFKINLNDEVNFSFVCFLLCLYRQTGRQSQLRSGGLDYSGSKSDTRIYM